MAKAKDGDITLASLMTRYANEEQAWIDLEQLVWRDGRPVCPHCGTIDHAYYLTPKEGQRTTRKGTVSYRRIWKCGSCLKKFSVLKGTIFEDSKIPVSKWLIGIFLLMASKNGVAANELRRTLDLSYEAAWFMTHRIRHALAPSAPQRRFAGTVEADETYIGGKRKAYEPENKTPVFTLVERGGDARSRVMQTVTGENVKEVLWSNVEGSAKLYTDEARIYDDPGKDFITHEAVHHKEEEWVRGDVHTNTAEGFFSQLKRSIDGTHHHVSAQHLPRYLTEFDYRYNTRKESDSDRMKMAVKRTRGKRLMYEETIG